MIRTTGLALFFAAALPVPSAMAQDAGQITDVEIVGHVYKPAQLDPTDAHIQNLQLPDRFRIEKFAEDLGNPRMIAVAEDGTVYVTRREEGDCLMLRDTNGDGRADEQQVVAQKPYMHGIAIRDGRIYLAAVTEVYVTDIQEDGTLGALEPIIDNLPDGGQHPNRTIAFGPDGMLYVSVGSTCNSCAETNDENATILRTSPDGSQRTIFASGLRNTIGFDWHPETDALWGMDHGTDWLGDDEQQEELNRLIEGKKYGWPYVYADGKINPADEPPNGTTSQEWAEQSEEPVLLHTAHSAPMQMAFYTGAQFPEDYRNDAFVAMRGSWNRKPPSGYEVVRIDFQDGEPVAIEPFLTGFLIGREDGSHAIFGRPVGLAAMPDGSMLIGDDTNGVIYRIAYGQPDEPVAETGSDE